MHQSACPCYRCETERAEEALRARAGGNLPTLAPAHPPLWGGRALPAMRSAGDAEVRDYSVPTDDEWRAMTATQRQAWIDSRARTEQERNALISASITGGLTAIRTFVNEQRAADLAEQREGNRVRIAQIEADARAREDGIRRRIAEEERDRLRAENERLLRASSGGGGSSGGSRRTVRRRSANRTRSRR